MIMTMGNAGSTWLRFVATVAVAAIAVGGEDVLLDAVMLPPVSAFKGALSPQHLTALTCN